MTITYRDSGDFQKVEAARKRNGRPTYYSADQGTDVEISQDFEAALILIPASAKQECRQRFDAQDEQAERVQKRDGILKAALKVDAENAQDQLTELQEKITTLQSFKEKFQSFAEVGEIGLLLRDAQLDMDELILAADRAKNRAVVAVALADRVDNGSISDALNKERQSWSRVLTEYSAT